MAETATRTRAFPFGKHNGKMVSDPGIPLEYLSWWLDTIEPHRYTNELRAEILAEIKARRQRLPFENPTSTRPLRGHSDKADPRDFTMYSSNATGRQVTPPQEIQREWESLKAAQARLDVDRKFLEAEKRKVLEEKMKRAATVPSVIPSPKLPAGVGLSEILAVVSAGRQAMAKRLHPDVGGSHEQMQLANQAADWLESFVRGTLGLLGGGK
jgi:uncharacterized protein (DUF3820 family)